MDKPVLIVNPRARGKLSEKASATLVGLVSDGLGPLDVRFTERPGHARDLAREEAAAGRALVVACGGDGTISEVTNGLVDAGPSSGAALGIIPRGTGGDFRRTLNLPDDLAEAARALKTAPVTVVDVGRVTYTNHAGEREVGHFVNAASFGFSAAVGGAANRSPKRMGPKVAFLGAVVRTLASYANVEVSISVDGAAPRRRTVLLGAVGNARFFGGGMKICPDARLDDGELDFVVVGDYTRLNVMTRISRIYAGTHTTLPNIESSRARRIEITPVDPDARIPIELDGETPGHLPAVFEIVPQALRLRF